MPGTCRLLHKSRPVTPIMVICGELPLVDLHNHRCAPGTMSAGTGIAGMPSSVTVATSQFVAWFASPVAKPGSAAGDNAGLSPAPEPALRSGTGDAPVVGRLFGPPVDHLPGGPRPSRRPAEGRFAPGLPIRSSCAPSVTCTHWLLFKAPRRVHSPLVHPRGCAARSTRVRPQRPACLLH